MTHGVANERHAAEQASIKQAKQAERARQPTRGGKKYKVYMATFRSPTEAARASASEGTHLLGVGVGGEWEGRKRGRAGEEWRREEREEREWRKRGSGEREEFGEDRKREWRKRGREGEGMGEEGKRGRGSG